MQWFIVVVGEQEVVLESDDASAYFMSPCSGTGHANN
jgi:hypothetical protein